MFPRRCLGVVCLLVATGVSAAAQDQTIIVDQPLKLCGGFAKAALDEAQAASLVTAALGNAHPGKSTYYIVHATQFVPATGATSVRMTVAEEHWYVYYKPWQGKTNFWWFKDSRQFQHFKDTRIFGSSDVALVYLYVNVPTYESHRSLNDVAAFFLKKETKEQKAQDNAEKVALESDTTLTPAEREAQVNRKREERLQTLTKKLEDDLTPEAEAEARTKTGGGSALVLISWLEAERYLKALAVGDATITDELPLVNRDNGERLVGLSPTLATAGGFKALSTLFYRVDVTKKIPAPLQNLNAAITLAFGGQAAAATRLGVPLALDTAVCAGRTLAIKPLPSNMLVKAITMSSNGEEQVERSKQTFDNERKYWWDISLALPLKDHDDLTIDVSAGQVAAKKVEKTDLFAVVNLGMRRDTKRLQWQLIPTFVYGLPITGKPLQHHLVGFTIGLNYIQLLGGMRFDRRQQVATTSQNGTPVGVESTPSGTQWDHEWVWGLNIPVTTVVNLLKKK